MLKITDNIKLGKLVGSSGSTSGSSGGSSNYNDLENKPSINGVSLDGNKTSADLGVLDVNTTELQTIKSGLNVFKEFFISDDNNQPVFLIQNLQSDPYGDTVGIATPNTLLFGGVKGIIVGSSPIVINPTALADLPDNALLTKAQVQEMINNALNNS